MLRTFSAVLMLTATTASTFAQSKAFDITRIDKDTDACTDFFQYANGAWLKGITIPGDRSSYGSFDILFDTNQKTLHDILENAAKNSKAAPGSSEQLISDMYASCMDEAAIEKAGIRPIEPYLAQIDKIKDARDLQMVIGKMHYTGIPAVFRFGSTIDAKNSNLNIAAVSQSELSLPTRNYYLDDKFKEIKDKFVIHVTDITQR